MIMRREARVLRQPIQSLILAFGLGPADTEREPIAAFPRSDLSPDENSALFSLSSTIALAKLRTLSARELIDLLPVLPDLSDQNTFFLRLGEVKLGSLVRAANKSIDSLIEQHRGSGYPAQLRLDRTLYRLARVLPRACALHIANVSLFSRRKSRRQAAYRAFRIWGTPPEFEAQLLDLYQVHGDEDLLTLVVRSGNALEEPEVSFLLRELSERYWRARALEVFLRHAGGAVLQFATDYKTEIVHAIGRTSDPQHLTILARLRPGDHDPFDYISLFIWAAGKLGDSGLVGAASDLAVAKASQRPDWIP